MTTIIIERELLEQAKNLLSRFMPDNFRDQDDQIEMLAKMDAALEAPAAAPEQMPSERNCVCDPYVHLDGYSGGAAKEGLYGALWVVAEGVRKKYVLADQVSEPKAMPAPATAPDEQVRKDAERKPMTIDEAFTAWNSTPKAVSHASFTAGVRAAEAFHGIKGTP